jgi:hypothetical protein
MPVTALPASEAETQVGQAKIAEPDVDAFMAYAAIGPEYCLLEGMLDVGKTDSRRIGFFFLLIFSALLLLFLLAHHARI